MGCTAKRVRHAGAHCGLAARRPKSLDWPFRFPAGDFAAGAAALTITAASGPHRLRSAPHRSDSAFTLSHSCGPAYPLSTELLWPLPHGDEPKHHALQTCGLERAEPAGTQSSSHDEFGSDIDLNESAPVAHTAKCAFSGLNAPKQAPLVVTTGAQPGPCSCSSKGGLGACDCGGPYCGGLLRGDSGSCCEGVGSERPDAALSAFMAQCAALAYERSGAAEAAVRRWGFHWEGSAGPDGVRSASWYVAALPVCMYSCCIACSGAATGSVTKGGGADALRRQRSGSVKVA